MMQWLFWKPRADLKLTPAEVVRELIWGEDVEGLVDLPIKEIIERLKGAFGGRETPGLLTIPLAGGPCEIHWSWQHVRAACAAFSPEEKQRLTEILGEFGCLPHEAS
ncbi:MAG: hypothetical protein SFU86_08850 [Pirellulaceae bacterium]|nr:hypothetical protein [Pirellulaceae bacterium]